MVATLGFCTGPSRCNTWGAGRTAPWLTTTPPAVNWEQVLSSIFFSRTLFLFIHYFLELFFLNVLFSFYFYSVARSLFRFKLGFPLKKDKAKSFWVREKGGGELEEAKRRKRKRFGPPERSSTDGIGEDMLWSCCWGWLREISRPNRPGPIIARRRKPWPTGLLVASTYFPSRTVKGGKIGELLVSLSWSELVSASLFLAKLAACELTSFLFRP